MMIGDKMKTNHRKRWLQSCWSSFHFAKVNVAFNALFAISGGVFICMGLYLFFTFTRTGIAIPGFPLRIPWLLVILGISILVTVLLASLPTEELLYKFFYSSVLFVYGVVELFTGGYLSQYYDTVRTSFKKNLIKHIENYLNDNEKLMDSIQYQSLGFYCSIYIKFQCCGADGPEDWLNSPAKRIPSSCCKVHFCVTTDISGVHDVGCEFMIMYCLNLRLTVMAIVTILIALLPLCGGFLVLFEAYNKAAGYSEIPTQGPATNESEVIPKKSLGSPKNG